MALVPQPRIGTRPPNAHASDFEAEHGQFGLPDEIYWYRSDTGADLWCVARYTTAYGPRLVPWSFDGRGWRGKPWPAPRGLYGLESIAALDDAKLLIASDEYNCQAARRILANPWAISWHGGAAGVAHTDLSPLTGRRVVIWPAATSEGYEAARRLAERLAGIASTLEIIDTQGEPEGFDLALLIGTGATRESIGQYARAHAVSPSALTAITRPITITSPIKRTTAALQGTCEEPPRDTDGLPDATTTQRLPGPARSTAGSTSGLPSARVGARGRTSTTCSGCYNAIRRPRGNSPTTYLRTGRCAVRGSLRFPGTLITRRAT